MAADILALLLRLNLAAGVAIVVIIALRNPLRRILGARLAYGLWTALPLAMGACLLPARSFVALAPPSLPLDAAAEAAIEWVASPQTVAPMQAVTPGGGLDAALLLLLLWGVGAALSLAAVAVVQRRSVAKLGALRPTGDARVMRADRSGFGPALVGAFFPRIVVPADFEDCFSAQERTVILAHERFHLANGDGTVNAVLVFCQCVNWFNPLIHLAARLLRLDQELACDAAVMARHPDARRAYAEALLKTQLAPVPLPLACYWPARGDNPLKERLVMLKRTAPGRGRKIAGAVSIVVVATASGYAAWASSPQVETLAVEAPRLLEHSLAASASPATSPAIKVKTVLAAPKRVSAVESRRVERDLSAVTQAELALVAARTRYERSVGTRRDVINAADRLGVLQSRFGLKETGYEAAVTEVRDDLADVRARFEHGLASRDDIINAATRLGGLQARLGEKATGYDDALTGAKADLEAVRRGRQFGVSTLADLSLAEERVTVLERLAGR